MLTGRTLLDELSRYVTKRIWFLSCFAIGLKTGADFSHFDLKLAIVSTNENVEKKPGLKTSMVYIHYNFRGVLPG